jgi:uncharacterized membrane protein
VTAPAAAPVRGRYAPVDMVRGVAIGLMIIYHFSWDLSFFHLADFRVWEDPAWRWFASIIVTMFLSVTGLAQVLAVERGRNLKVFVRRLGLVVACAALISAATYWVDPASYIFFGILHHIALASVVAVVVLPLPTVVLFGLAVLCFAAPALLTGPAFGASWLLWLGLNPAPPLSVDYVPFLPWFGMPLLGMVAGRLIIGDGRMQKLLHWRPVDPVSRVLHFAGRRSLAIYMLHQPLLFGALYLFVMVREKL